MSFAFNPSLSHIDINEPYVVEMYRSAKEVLLPDARFKGHPCEAYICLTKIEKRLIAYVALLETGRKGIFVYTSDFATENSADYPKVLAEANEFVKSLGFAMERVNIDFGAAMREVIIKGFRVMRPPPKVPEHRTLGSYKPGEPKTGASAAVIPKVVSAHLPDTAPLPLEITALQTELTTVRAVIEQVTEEKHSLKLQAAREIAALKASLEKAVESKQASEQRLSLEIEAIKKEGAAAAVRRDSTLATTLKTELDSTLKKAEHEIKALSDEISTLNKSVETHTQQNLNLASELSTVKNSATEKISRLTAEKNVLTNQLADERQASAAKIASLTVFESQWREGQQRQEELCRNIDQMKAQLDLLEAERHQGKERETALTRLTAEKDALNSQLADERRASAAKIASLTVFETQWQEGQQREEELCSNLDQMKAQLDLLEAERRQEKERETALTSRIASLEEELAASGMVPEQKDDYSLAQKEMAVQFKKLEAEKNAIEAEFIRLANDNIDKETEIIDALYAAEAEVLRLSRELEIHTQIADMENAALREKLKQMAMSNVTLPDAASSAMQSQLTATMALSSPPVSGSRIQMPQEEAKAEISRTVSAATAEVVIPQAHPEEAGIDSAEVENPDEPVISDYEVTKGLMNEFGSFCGNNGHSVTDFSINPAITTIEYSDPAEIVAILYSSNTVQAVPDGSKIQRCKGYVIATKKDEQFCLYIAWYLTESKKTVICTPEHQPADAAECTTLIKDAVSYFEIVGFMLEIEDLGSTRKSYTQAIRKVPAISRR